MAVHLGTWGVSWVERIDGNVSVRSVHFVAARNAAIAKELVAKKTGASEADLLPYLVRMDSTPMSTQYWNRRRRDLEVYVGRMETLIGPLPKIECKSCGGSGKRPGDTAPGLSCGPCGGTGLQRVR
jgi:hypothetical protein